MVPNPTIRRRYQAYFGEFMNVVFGTDHPVDYEYTVEVRSTITPQHVVKYFNYKVYGSPVDDILPERAAPNARSSTLGFIKKSISYFMPNQNHQFNEIAMVGNPTRSKAVNDYIVRLKQLEVRQEAVPTRAKRPLEHEEYRAIINCIRKRVDHSVCNISTHQKHYALAAMMLWQYALIGRLDDAAQTKTFALFPNLRFPDALEGQLTWSKNILEERQAPHQILLASMESELCLFIALSNHLEGWIALNGGVMPSDFMFVIGGNGLNPTSSKSAARAYLMRVLGEPDFIAIYGDLRKKVGTHSLRKAAATAARRGGASVDDVGFRGRWKNRRGGNRTVSLFCFFTLKKNNSNFII